MQWDDWAVVGVVLLCLVDWAMSAPFWHLESWPVALALGPWGTLIAKLVAVSGLVSLWIVYRDGWGVWSRRTAQTCVCSLLGWYSVIVTSNAVVLLG